MNTKAKGSLSDPRPLSPRAAPSAIIAQRDAGIPVASSHGAHEGAPPLEKAEAYPAAIATSDAIRTIRADVRVTSFFMRKEDYPEHSLNRYVYVGSTDRRLYAIKKQK